MKDSIGLRFRVFFFFFFFLFPIFFFFLPFNFFFRGSNLPVLLLWRLQELRLSSQVIKLNYHDEYQLLESTDSISHLASLGGVSPWGWETQ